MQAIDKNIKIIDRNGKVLAELGKVMKDVTVEEFKKILSNFAPAGKCIFMQEITQMGLSLRHPNDIDYEKLISSIIAFQGMAVERMRL